MATVKIYQTGICGSNDPNHSLTIRKSTAKPIGSISGVIGKSGSSLMYGGLPPDARYIKYQKVSNAYEMKLLTLVTTYVIS